MKKIQAAFLILLGTSLAVSGCASTSKVAEVQAQAADAQRTADLALSTAQNAMQTAQQARSTAQEANDRSYRTEEMLDRGFRRSMRK
jgi:hypothetical protein